MLQELVWHGCLRVCVDYLIATCLEINRLPLGMRGLFVTFFCRNLPDCPRGCHRGRGRGHNSIRRRYGDPLSCRRRTFVLFVDAIMTYYGIAAIYVHLLCLMDLVITFSKLWQTVLNDNPVSSDNVVIGPIRRFIDNLFIVVGSPGLATRWHATCVGQHFVIGRDFVSQHSSGSQGRFVRIHKTS